MLRPGGSPLTIGIRDERSVAKNIDERRQALETKEQARVASRAKSDLARNIIPSCLSRDSHHSHNVAMVLLLARVLQATHGKERGPSSQGTTRHKRGDQSRACN